MYSPPRFTGGLGLRAAVAVAVAHMIGVRLLHARLHLTRRRARGQPSWIAQLPRATIRHTGQRRGHQHAAAWRAADSRSHTARVSSLPATTTRVVRFVGYSCQSKPPQAPPHNTGTMRWVALRASAQVPSTASDMHHTRERRCHCKGDAAPRSHWQGHSTQVQTRKLATHSQHHKPL